MADDTNPGAPNPDAIVPAASAPPPAAPPPEVTPTEHVPGYLRVWRAVWGTNPTPAHDGPPPPTDGTREIVETIVFVVVLVLMLRCFVAEAFVIPTGSMAETLYGYQKMVTCPQCEFFFPVNCSAEVEAAQEGHGPRVSATNECTCPNCRLAIALVPPGEPPDPRLKGQPIPDPGFSTGDRVLVAKFLYDLLGRMPNRLDVVVFKFPGDGDKGGAWPGSGPQQKGVPMNYIKRLVGLPGETIYIYRGDLYHSATPDPKKYFDEDFRDCPDPNSEEHRQRKLFLWRKNRDLGGGTAADYTHAKLVDPSTAEHKAILAEMKAGTIKIVRKPAAQILAMRRIVFDNDHQPADLVKAGEAPRWQPGEGWAADGTTFVGKAGETTAWLRYSNRLRGVPDPQFITDFLGYNTDPHTGQGGGGHHWVKDLMLECEVDVAKAQGQFSLELSAGVDRFRAVWDLATGTCTLHRLTPHSAAFAATLGLEKGDVLGKAETKLKGPGKYRVRFANIDRQLVVWVDGALPFGPNGVAYEAPEYQDSKDFNDREQPASVGLADAEVTVRHLSLWRDVFYTNGQRQAGLGADNAGAIFQMYVQPDHYLCMGDNSPASSDGRSWGLVPNRLLLGKAQMVYYPFYFPWWPLKAPVNRVGLIR